MLFGFANNENLFKVFNFARMDGLTIDKFCDKWEKECLRRFKTMF